jgi:MYXO-CTERM domain-containing protein
MFWTEIRTQFVTNPGTGCDTSNTGGGKHGSRVALVLLLLLFVGCSARRRVVVSLVAVGVAK